MKPRIGACPTCKGGAAPRPENAAFPFCCPRCKLVDLARWLDGSYRIAAGPASSAEAGGRSAETDEETNVA
jgi:endogenous inhibitor of DNA gyrase (YacG/DUF329 family)